MEPVVSIVMPAYNRANLLRRSLESVLGQTFQAWELIVVDDASTDETPRVLAEYAVRDPRIRVVRNETNQYRVSGIVGTLNKGIALAKGKYIARLDDDDYWIDPKKLEKQVAFLDVHPDCVVIGGGVVVVDGEGKERFRYLKKEEDADIRRSVLMANPFSHTTVLFRADTARALGGYTSKFAEDWDLWLSMGMRGTFHNLPDYVAGYTMTEANNSFIHQRAMSRGILKFLMRHRREYPNFWKAYLVNLAQYIYSFLPISLRKAMHSVLSSFKRSLS